MLGPETSQTRKTTAGTRTHGLPHAERVLYQLSQLDPDHAVKGPHSHTQKPPKTKALAKRKSNPWSRGVARAARSLTAEGPARHGMSHVIL